MFDIENVTFGNVYLEAGTDAPSRADRESQVLPNLLLNRFSVGCIGDDWNSIIDKVDATNNAASKLSPNLLRLSKAFKWIDSHKIIYPSSVSVVAHVIHCT